MSLKSNFELMANYNQEMNTRIYEAASQLSASELSENRGAFFGSVIGTLNHILVGDTIWLKRFSEHPSLYKKFCHIQKIRQPQSLDTILYSDFEALLYARVEMDRTITMFISELTDDILSSSLSYKNTKGKPFNQHFAYLIQHFFNHQTHHRGQVSTLLNQANIDIGITDLLLSIPDESKKE